MYVTVKSRGFTVIELLIIVIIVAVLVCIVIPAIFAAKQKAQQIICVNNLTRYNTHDKNESKFKVVTG